MKLQRLIAILTVLLQKDRVSAAVLAAMFEVSVRTIYRDIEALESAGIPIVTHAGVNGGISIIDQYKIDKKLFTNQDISTLLISLYSVSGSMPDAMLNQTLEKIKSLIPTAYGEEIALTTQQLHIDLTPWANRPQLTKTLKQIQQALGENKCIHFVYTGRDGDPAPRTAEPLQLVLKENNWYLRAFCHLRQDFRTFKLSRMSQLIISAQTFVARVLPEGLTGLKDWDSEKIIVVSLIVAKTLRERVSDYCREETMTDLEDGRIYVQMPFVESEMGYSVLLGFGHQCEVLHPPFVCAELIRRIDLLKAVYEPLIETGAQS